MMTTAQVATELGIQPGSVRKLIERGVLGCEKIGRDWLISRDELERYKLARRQPGKPRKQISA